MPEKAKVNAKLFVDTLLPKLVADCKTLLPAGFIFQQDGAPAHARLALNCFAPNCTGFNGKDEWPPNSPDLNPLDYYVWGDTIHHYHTFQLKPKNIQSQAARKRNTVIMMTNKVNGKTRILTTCRSEIPENFITKIGQFDYVERYNTHAKFCDNRPRAVCPTNSLNNYDVLCTFPFLPFPFLFSRYRLQQKRLVISC